MEGRNIQSALEAILFVAGEAVPLEDIAMALDVDRAAVEDAADALELIYEQERRGFVLMRFEDKAQLGTRAEYADAIERVLNPIRRQPLPQAAMETLAVVAYRQPVTRMEVEAVRGVRCERMIATLLRHGLIQELGRKDAVGRPILYGTTEEFLRHFGIRGLEELPPIDPPALPMEWNAQDDGQDAPILEE